MRMRPIELPDGLVIREHVVYESGLNGDTRLALGLLLTDWARLDQWASVLSDRLRSLDPAVIRPSGHRRAGSGRNGRRAARRGVAGCRVCAVGIDLIRWRDGPLRAADGTLRHDCRSSGCDRRRRDQRRCGRDRDWTPRGRARWRSRRRRKCHRPRAARCPADRRSDLRANCAPSASLGNMGRERMSGLPRFSTGRDAVLGLAHA